MSWFRGRRARRRAKAGAAVGVVVATALVAQMSMVSNASWNDEEWVNADVVGTVDCTDPSGAFATRGEGRALSGSLLGTSLDSLAKVSGVQVTNNGTTATPSPASAAPANSIIDAYADPLDITTLSAINLDLTNLLQLPLDTDTGLLGQYAQATIPGDAAGASGYIINSGAINADGEEAGYPHIATLQLSTLLDSLGFDLGSPVAHVLDLSLDVGAVAGRASLTDPCQATWDTGISGAVERDYLAAGVDMRAEIELVGALVTAVDTAVTGLEAELNNILGTTGLLAGVTTSLVNGLTDALGLVTGLVGLRVAPNGTTVNLASIDLALSPLNTFLTTPITDSKGILSVSLSDDSVRIDTAALLGAVYGDSGRTTLNGLAPNTNLLSTPGMTTALTAALTEALGEWISTVDGLLTSAVNLAIITINVEIPFQKCSLIGLGDLCIGTWQNAGKIHATVAGTLAQLLDGTATVTVDTSALNLGLIGGLLTGLLGAVTDILGSLLGPLVGAILEGPITNQLLPIAKLPADTLLRVGGPIDTTLSSLFTLLADVDVLSVTINAQNNVAETPSNQIPLDLRALPVGQFEVAAIRVGVLESASNGVTLYLGRGSVGPVCSPVAAAAGACAGY